MLKRLILSFWGWIISIDYWGLRLCVLAGALFFTSCKSIKEPPVAVPYGPVISIQGDWVEVSFEVINKTPGSQIAGWFYCPLHSYKKGNIFPDFTKYKHPR